MAGCRVSQIFSPDLAFFIYLPSSSWRPGCVVWRHSRSRPRMSAVPSQAAFCKGLTGILPMPMDLPEVLQMFWDLHPRPLSLSRLPLLSFPTVFPLLFADLCILWLIDWLIFPSLRLSSDPDPSALRTWLSFLSRVVKSGVLYGRCLPVWIIKSRSAWVSSFSITLRLLRALLLSSSLPLPASPSSYEGAETRHK